MSWFDRFVDWLIRLFGADPDDPVRSCEFYCDLGCCHVDGPLCDMKTCQELKDYRKFIN